MEAIEITKTIRSQIGMLTMMRIGAKNYMALPRSADRLGGIVFEASLFGRKRCRVVVELTEEDLYRARIERPRNGEIVASMGDSIFCEDISGVIEAAVEGWFNS